MAAFFRSFCSLLKIPWDVTSLPDLGQSKNRTFVPYWEVTIAPKQLWFMTRCWPCDAMLASLLIVITSQIILTTCYAGTRRHSNSVKSALAVKKKGSRGRKPSAKKKLVLHCNKGASFHREETCPWLKTCHFRQEMVGCDKKERSCWLDMCPMPWTGSDKYQELAQNWRKDTVKGLLGIASKRRWDVKEGLQGKESPLVGGVKIPALQWKPI